MNVGLVYESSRSNCSSTSIIYYLLVLLLLV